MVIKWSPPEDIDPELFEKYKDVIAKTIEKMIVDGDRPPEKPYIWHYSRDIQLPSLVEDQNQYKFPYWLFKHGYWK